jgi:hypothetical protein
MEFNSFVIGKQFQCGGRTYRTTDVGRRVVVAIELDHPEDTSWYNGPPYGVPEIVFDENDFGGCSFVSKTIKGEKE